MFSNLKLIFQSFNRKERFVFVVSFAILLISFITRVSLAIAENSKLVPVAGGIYTEGVIGQPTALNPIISSNQVDQDINELLYAHLADLLENYDISKDGRTYNLKIKKDLLWSDGQPLTSDDVVFTIKTVEDPSALSIYGDSWEGVLAERLSELQVRLSLPTPYSFFMKNIKSLPIVPKHIFGNIPVNNLALSNYNLEPVASGPYQVKNFSKKKDGFITEYHLVPNKNYSGAGPFIQNFYFKFFENEKELIENLASRKINGFGSMLPNLSFLNIGKTIATTIPMSRYYALFYNLQINPMLKEKNFRYALNYAIDKEKINKDVFGNSATMIASPLFNMAENPISAPLSFTTSTIAMEKNIGTRDITEFNYDLEKAKTYFEKIKLSDRENIELNIVVPEVDFLKNIAEIVKKSWLELGLSKINIIPLNSEDIVNNVFKSRNYEIALFGNILENPNDLFPFWHSSQRFYPGLNLSLYQNSKVDVLIENVRQNVKNGDTIENLNLLAKTITGDAPADFLFTLPYTYIHSNNLNGFAFDSSSTDAISNPSERFKNINQWYAVKARVLK